MQNKIVFSADGFMIVQMKKLISILFLSSLFFSLTSKAELTSQQESIVINDLNTFCSDAWCESATDFQFQRISCSDETAICDLHFTTQDNSKDDNPIFDRTCEIKYFRNLEQMVYLNGNLESGYRSEGLKDQFVEQVNVCVERFY